MSNRRHRKSFDLPGHAHELTFSCYKRYPFFKSERTATWLADAVHAAKAKHDFALWAYVVMPDHVHLLIKPNNEDHHVASILKAIKEPVGRRAIQYLKRESPAWLEKVTRRRGQRIEHLFWQSGGGYDRNIDQPQTLWKVIDYIHNNPVRKGLIERAIDWNWSSANWHETKVPGPIEVDPIDW